MDYTLSVYLPEVAMQGSESPSREELMNRASIKAPSHHEGGVPLLVNLLRQMKQSQFSKPDFH